MSQTSGPYEARGIVLTEPDLSYPHWPELVAQCGLNVIALHVLGGPPSKLVSFVETDGGQAFLNQVAAAGLDLEYELHACGELLPRELFERDPEMFRMDEDGERKPDCNLCVSSPAALEVIGENAAKLAARLTPTTHRYYYWGDDGRPWCRCPTCRELSPADQNLVAVHAILRGLREFDPRARAAALAYHDTLTPPEHIAPEPGVFLEYAPIRRSWEVPLNDPDCAANREHVASLRRLVEFFGTEGAQVLEYWLDASRHSGWKRPAKMLPVTPEVMAADLEFYASLGFRRATTFGVFLDQEYFEMYGPPPVKEYGAAFPSRYRPRS